MVRRILLMLAGLAVLTTAVYWQVHRFGFIDFDDADYVYSNRYVLAGFTAPSVHHALVTYAMGNWNPLLWFSFYADRALLHARAGPMHVENALLHLITGILLWRLLFVSTGSLNRSWVVAALFLVHPMHVESVAWVSERKDVLSTPILFAAILAYVWYCRHRVGDRRWIAYIAMLVLFAISLMVKTMGVTLPAVLLLLDFWPLRRWPDRSWIWLVIEKLPLVAISIAASIVGSIAQYRTGATVTFAELSLLDRIDNAIVCYVLYIVKIIVPINLAVFYPHPQSRPAAAVFAAAVLLAMMTYFFYRLRQRCPYAMVGWLWFLGTLFPVMGLLQLGSEAMADRYSYFPSIGLFIVLVWGVGDLLRRLRWAEIQTSLAIGIILVLAIVCRRQVSFWENSELLFTHALNVADDSAVAHVVLAQMAFEKGDIQRAVDQNNLALKHGDYARAYFGLGMCWVAEKPDLACEYFRKAVNLEPRAVIFHVKYAAALLQWGHYDEALKQAQEAVHLDHGDAGARDELAKVTEAKPK